MGFEIGSRLAAPKAGTSQFHGVAFDEAHLAKNPRSARGRAAVATCGRVDGVRLMMTGTPMPNDTRELIQLLLAMGVLSETPGTRRMTPESFRARFCKNPTPEAKAELARFLRASGLIRRLKADVAADLPDKQRIDVRVPLTETARAEYDRIALEGLARIEYDPGHVIVLLGRLRRALALAKAEYAVEWAADFLAGTSRPLVIFAHHTDVQAAIIAGLEDRGYPACALLGAQADTEAHKARFQAGQARVIVCSYKSAGYGHTLTAASDILLAEQMFSPGEHWQAEDRCHRIGTVHPVTAWYLLAERTLDRWIYEIVAGKVADIKAVIDASPDLAVRVPAMWYRDVLRADYGLRPATKKNAARAA